MRRPCLADNQPYIGQTVAAMDESVREAGSGVYYVLALIITKVPATVAKSVLTIVGERQRPFHYSREGPEIIERMLSLMENEAIKAICRWRPAGRKRQVEARNLLLEQQARTLVGCGVDHLIIESGDEATDNRDRSVLLDTFGEDGGIPYAYDWRSKSEPLLWIADAVGGIVAEYLLDIKTDRFHRLHNAELIEVTNQ